MTGWTPLFQQIIGSSVWNSPNHVRIAWVTLLASADKDGVAAVTIGGLAVLARISREEAEDAIKVLSSPDPDTLTQENEGRRIERDTCGWRLLNWGKYREKAKSIVTREINRENQAKYRDSVKAAANTPNKEEVESIIAHMNTVTGRSFRLTESHIEIIRSRLSEEGVTPEGVKSMITRQWANWRGTTMEEFMRPQTLFSKSKFDSYYAAKDLPSSNAPKNVDSNQIQEVIVVRDMFPNPPLPPNT